MQSISDIISKILKEHQLELDDDTLARSALNNDAVKDFLNKNQDKITSEMVESSLANLYSFVQQITGKSNSVIVGYQPSLFINGNIIDIRYTPTEQKIVEDEKRRAKNRIELIDLPLKLRNVELASVDQNDDRKIALLEIATFLRNFKNDYHSKGLYLEGDFGVGKTYLLAGLANAIARQGTNVVFLHVPSFIASLSSHFQDNSLNDEIEKISKVPVLIFDDIGAETLSEWSRDDVLGVILQKRMDNDLPTFFSSNMRMKELEEHFSETKNKIDIVKAKRLMQRVQFLSKEIIVGGKNYRN